MPRYEDIPSSGMIIRRCENCGELVEVHKIHILVQISECRSCANEKKITKLENELRLMLEEIRDLRMILRKKRENDNE